MVSKSMQYFLIYDFLENFCYWNYYLVWIYIAKFFYFLSVVKYISNNTKAEIDDGHFAVNWGILPQRSCNCTAKRWKVSKGGWKNGWVENGWENGL